MCSEGVVCGGVLCVLVCCVWWRNYGGRCVVMYCVYCGAVVWQVVWCDACMLELLCGRCCGVVVGLLCRRCVEESLVL